VYRQTLGNVNYWGDQAPRDALKPYTNLLQDLEVGGFQGLGLGLGLGFRVQGYTS
jgi:hypothetical protein